MIRNNKQSGFTLIETLLYVVLFSFIMVGTLISIYGIMGSSARNKTKAMIEEEGSFIIGKIDWALTGAKNLEVNNSGKKLSIIKSGITEENQITISYSDGIISIQKGSHASKILNNANIKISCPEYVCFIYESGSGDGINPESITALITLTALTSEGKSISEDFSTHKYLHK